jgi:hypothetical protein
MLRLLPVHKERTTKCLSTSKLIHVLLEMFEGF